jgi:hypothetical protein
MSADGFSRGTPAPAERQPCAAWVHYPASDDPDDHECYALGEIAEVWECRGGWEPSSKRVVGGWAEHVIQPTLAAAQLAAEDALEADAREVLALLGKGGA